MKWYRLVDQAAWKNVETGEVLSDVNVQLFKSRIKGPVGDSSLDYLSQALKSHYEQTNVANQQNQQNWQGQLGQLAQLSQKLGTWPGAQQHNASIQQVFARSQEYNPYNPFLPPDQPKPKVEDEFTWLRRRVKEVSWKA